MKSKPTYEELLNEVAILKEKLSEENSDKDYKLFFENNEAIILFVNPDNQDIMFANESAQKFYGYNKDQFSRMKISDIHTLSPDEIRIKISEAKKRDQNYFEFKHKLSSGEIKDVEVYQTKLTLHDKVIFSLIIFDITEKKKAESILFESELKYRDYFEKDISGFYRSTPEGKLLFCNSAFANMLGYDTDELLSINMSKLYPYIGNRESFIEEISLSKNILIKEIDLVKKNGEIIHCIENVAGIFDEHGNLYQFQGFIFNITERKKTEIALKESELRFKRLFEDLGDAVFVTRIGGKNRGDILEVNSAAVLQTGYSKEELLEMNIIHDIFVEGSGDISIEDWDEKLHREDIVTTVEQKRRKDGTVFWTEVIVTPIEYNGIPASLSINHDITNRINSNKALEESERKFRELFEKSGDAFLIIKNRMFIDCNSSAIKMLNYSNKDEFTNTHPSALSPEFQPDGKQSLTKANEMMSICIEKGTHRFEWNHTKKNGEVFPVEVLLTAISSEPGNEIIHTVWRDITERNKAKDELINAVNQAERNEKKFRDLYEKSADAIFIVKNGKFTDCNLATLDMFLYESREELLKLHPWDISPKLQPNGEQSSKKAIQNIDIAIKIGTYRFEWEHMRKNGEVFPCEILLTAIPNEKDKPIVHAVCRDITERSMNQQELIKAKEKAEESDRLKSAFLANMSHEIRTPMNGILGFASLLKLPNLNREQLKKYVNIIEKSGIRMLNIINDLMDISKIEAGQMEVNMTNFDLNEQIEYLYSFFLPEAEKEDLKIYYEYSLEGEEAIIYSDNEKLYAVLANLLKNSIKYSEEGTINFGYEKKENELIFHVRDTGMGIPKDRQDAVFDRFVQADIEDSKAMEGAGLGLAISKAYVELLNGQIWLESFEGKGTTFYFSIPYICESQEKINNETEISDNKKTGLNDKKLNILIADDEVFANTFLQIVLKDISRNIYTATNGKEVLDILRSNDDIDLILMDIKMPLLNGYEATEEIRKFNKDVIIIAQTAYALPGDYSKAIDVGCNDYISKPIDKDILLNKIEYLFN